MKQVFYPPVIGQWYGHSSGKGQLFEVIAIDDDFTIEIQLFDGNLDLLELESWLEMDLKLESAPENCLGALDVPDLDDIGGHITDTSIDDWFFPFEELVLDDDNIVMVEREANHIQWREDLLH